MTKLKEMESEIIEMFNHPENDLQHAYAFGAWVCLDTLIKNKMVMGGTK